MTVKHRRYFQPGKAWLLGAALLCLASLPALATSPGIQHAMSNHVFQVVQEDGIDAQAIFLEDGTVILTGMVGRHEGRWRADGWDICLDFPSGPVAGQSCHRLRRVDEVTFQAGSGATLIRIASASRF